jgi:SnoaL-like polyketide cyclase
MSNRETFSHAIKCFSDPQRRNEYFQLYSDDIILHGYQGIEPGLESVKQFYYAFWKLFPDAKVLIQGLIGEGDPLVARYTITGTMHEPFGCSCDRTTNRTSRNQHLAFQKRPML